MSESKVSERHIVWPDLRGKEAQERQIETAKIVAQAETTRRGFKRRGRRVKVAERPAYDECGRRMLARQLHSWTLADDGTWTIKPTVDETLTLSLAEVKAWLGMGETVKKTTAGRRPATVTPIRPETAAVPSVVAEWLDRLVYPAKRDYAAAYAAARLNGGSLPADPDTDWASKARRKVDSLLASAPADTDRVA